MRGYSSTCKMPAGYFEIISLCVCGVKCPWSLKYRKALIPASKFILFVFARRWQNGDLSFDLSRRAINSVVLYTTECITIYMYIYIYIYYM